MKVKVTTTFSIDGKESTKAAEADVPASFAATTDQDIATTVQTLLRALQEPARDQHDQHDLLESAASALDDLIGYIEKQPVSKPIKLLGHVVKDSPGFIRAKAIHSVIREVLSKR